MSFAFVVLVFKNLLLVVVAGSAGRSIVDVFTKTGNTSRSICAAVAYSVLTFLWFHYVENASLMYAITH